MPLTNSPTKQAQREKTVFRIAGPPRRLRLLDTVCASNQSVRLTPKRSLNCFNEGQDLPCYVKNFLPDSPLDLRLRLPEDTLPGEYGANLQIGNTLHDAVITVEPKIKLAIFPKQFSLEGPPGATIRQEIMFENRGNTAIDIPKESSAIIYRNTGIPEALVSTLQLRTDNTDTLISNLIHRLKEGYGGRVKMQFNGAQHVITPKDRKMFEIVSRIPPPHILKQKGRHIGLLHLNDFHFFIHVNVLEDNKRGTQ